MVPSSFSDLPLHEDGKKRAFVCDLVRSLANKPHFALDWSFNKQGECNVEFDVDMMHELANVLKNDRHIHWLRLARHGARDAGAISLASALSAGCVLTVLDLSSNVIGDKGAIAIADALRVSPLRVLKLAKNNITSRGAAALFSVLLETDRLQKLDLSSNFIDNDELFGAVLASNASLTDLSEIS